MLRLRAAVHPALRMESFFILNTSGRSLVEVLVKVRAKKKREKEKWHENGVAAEESQAAQSDPQVVAANL